MNFQLRNSLIAAALLVAAATSVCAQAPTGSTGQCKDGTYSTATSKAGACRGHQGVQSWYATGGATAGASTKPAAAAAPVKPAAATPVAASGPAPAGSTGLCKDGTYTSGATKSGACRGHHGIQTWYAETATPAARPANPMSAASAAAPVPAPVQAPAAPRNVPAPPPASAARTTPAAPATSAAPAPGGGNGQVWVNIDTKVYHCSGDRFYGKTKKGAYMSEADAQAKGFRPDAGKTCPK